MKDLQSTMVRLRQGKAANGNTIYEFTIHYGEIKTVVTHMRHAVIRAFTIHYGEIKTISIPAYAQ